MIKDILVRLNININKVRGQCYDGASTMRGHKSGVSTIISQIEPRALYTHCYGHSLNLAASNSLNKSKVMKEALETTHEITKLIKFSPRRDNIFRKIKEDMTPGSPDVRVLCPTRWTVRADSLASVIENYDVLLLTWEEASSICKDTESKSRIQGVSFVMKTFNFVFGVMLGELILRHTDNLSSTLQKKSMSAAEGQLIASMTVQTLNSIRNDTSFDLFWTKVNSFATSKNISEPELPRQRKVPKRYEEGISTGYFPESPKEYYKQLFFEAVDLIVNCIKDRFDQQGYKIYSSLESLLMKSCKGESINDDLDFITAFYGDDLDKKTLQAQLQTFRVHFEQHKEGKTSKTSFFDLLEYFSNLSQGQSALMDQVCKLMQLVLVMPATNATSERSFSALRRVKSYLRATMLQERLNYLMLLHVHKERTDAICLKTVVNDFIGDSIHRSNIFGNY